MSERRELYLNIPVLDVDRTRVFFSELGFSFDPRFSNQDGLCMIVGEEAYVMHLRRPFFQTFTSRPVAEPERGLQALFALSAPSRAGVDQLFERAVALGGSEAHAPYDHGFMYGRSFFDLDGHQWEVIWMDEEAMP